MKKLVLGLVLAGLCSTQAQAQYGYDRNYAGTAMTYPALAPGMPSRTVYSDSNGLKLGVACCNMSRSGLIWLG